jgi:hypothetical protein
VPFAIQDSDDSYKFKNSETIVRYMLAAEDYKTGLAIKLLDRIFTGKNHEGVSYQTMFNEYYTHDETVSKLEGWLAESVDANGVKNIREKANSNATSEKMSKNRETVEKSLKVKGIPTMLFDGKKHTGLWKSSN